MQILFHHSASTNAAAAPAFPEVWSLRPRADLCAAVLTASFLLFLLLFGSHLHPMESEGGGSPERDYYVLQINQVMGGTLPRDEFRPLLYVLLSAVPGRIMADPFAGGQIVSFLAGTGLLLLVYRLGRAIDPRFGLLAMATMMLNAWFVIASLSVATDMLFSVLALAVMALSLRMLRVARRLDAAVLGCLFAICYFTRYTTIFLLPVVVLCLLMPADRGRRSALVNLFTFLGTALVALLPHFWINTRLFGSPFYNENWRNTALKLFSETVAYTRDLPDYRSLWAVIRANPTAFSVSALREAWFFLNGDGADALGMGGRGSLLGSLVLLCGLGGCLLMLVRPSLRRPALAGFLFMSVYITALCLTFVVNARFIMPLLPLFYIASLYFMWHLFGAGGPGEDAAGLRRWRAAVGLFLVLMFLSCGLRLYQFSRTHAVAERQAALQLEKRYGSGLSIAGSSVHIGRYLKSRYTFFPVVRDPEHATDWNRVIKEVLDRERADFVVIGRASIGQLPANLLRGTDLPAFLSPAEINPDVAVYRVNRG